MVSVGLQTRVSPARDVVTRECDSDLIVLDLQSGFCWQLNHTATALWTSLAAGKSAGETVSALSQGLDVNPERLQADTLAFVEQLLSAGLFTLA